MEDLSLHILDLAENSVTAKASRVSITIVEDYPADLLTVEIADDGKGMSPKLLAKARDPFVTTRTTRRVGLGIPLFARSCEEAGGTFEIESAPGKGTRLRGTLQYRHIDRRPLGNMTDTIITLIMGAPEVDWIYRHQRIRADGSDDCVELDLREIREQVGADAMSHPEVILAIRKSLREQAAQLKT